jgi:signal transduction histidine kinase/ActR/RegA family two-component response regulator
MWEFFQPWRAIRDLREELARQRRVEQELRARQAELERRLEELATARKSLPAEPAGGQPRATAEQVSDTELLREANSRKEHFLAILGHELRNPLSAIAGANQVISVIGSQDAELTQMHQIIERQTAYMSRMINDILEVSRISRGRIQIRPVRLDLVELVRNTIEDLRPTLAEGNLAVHEVLPEDPVQVEADPTRLTQVLANLVQNAAKFTDPGGTVTVTVGIDPRQRSANMTVQDTGVGMTSETLRHVFEPFSQVESSVERSRGGLGLGLMLVKGLVDLHGGDVQASSAGLGRGAEFTVRLPLAAPTSLLTSGPPAMPAVTRIPNGLRILIIDDQRDASYPMQKLLELDGHQVEVAANGPAGIQAACQFLPQVVLCDLGLPGMNGVQVAQAFRSDPRIPAALLVAVTGGDHELDRTQATPAGFAHQLTKPVGQTELRNLLAQVPPSAAGR